MVGHPGFVTNLLRLLSRNKKLWLVASFLIGVILFYKPLAFNEFTFGISRSISPSFGQFLVKELNKSNMKPENPMFVYKRAKGVNYRASYNPVSGYFKFEVNSEGDVTQDNMKDLGKALNRWLVYIKEEAPQLLGEKPLTRRNIDQEYHSLISTFYALDNGPVPTQLLKMPEFDRDFSQRELLVEKIKRWLDINMGWKYFEHRFKNTETIAGQYDFNMNVNWDGANTIDIVVREKLFHDKPVRYIFFVNFDRLALKKDFFIMLRYRFLHNYLNLSTKIYQQFSHRGKM